MHTKKKTQQTNERAQYNRIPMQMNEETQAAVKINTAQHCNDHL